MLIVQENRAIIGIAFLRMLGRPTDDELRVYLAAEGEEVTSRLSA